VGRHIIGFQAAYARRGIELGKRLALGSSSTSPRARKSSCARRRNITKEHEDVRRPAPRAGSLRADRGDARPEVRRDH